MPSREAIPLHRRRQAALIDHLAPPAHNVDPNKGTATLLLLGSGIRNDTCGHCHRDWFHYDSGELYLQVPTADECRKDTDGPCSRCDSDADKPWYPKTPAGGGRMIHIGNHYYDYSTGQKRYMGLRDRVEQFFGIAPPGEQAVGGYPMFQANNCDGAGRGTITRWVRSMCTAAGISKQERANRLRKSLTPNMKENDDGEEVVDKTVAEMIADNGTDSQGRPIPDVFAHDLRATYCTQLCRCDNPNYTEIKRKTGHKHEETLYTYVGYASDEIDPRQDAELF